MTDKPTKLVDSKPTNNRIPKNLKPLIPQGDKYVAPAKSTATLRSKTYINEK